MTKPIPQIQKYMTTTPKFVEKDSSLLEAAKMMQTNGFRHLPVLYNGQIEGVLSATDVQLVTSLKNVNLDALKVMDAYTPNPMKVTPHSAIDEVAREMALHKIGCVIVEDNKHLVGIFTWIDALRAMDELLHTRLK